MFPGLGEHYPGMGRELYESEPGFRTELDRCAELLRPLLKQDLIELIYPPIPEAEAAAGPEIDLRRMLGRMREEPDEASQRLRRTAVAHPAVFAVEYALARLWMSWGIEPQALIGYSLGEYVAACLAGVMSLEDALRLVVERAEMIEALPAGGMLAVPLGEAEIRPLLGDGLDLAVINSAEDCVVAGGEEALAELALRLEDRGVVSRRLETSHAFHSREMQPIFEPFADRLRRIGLQPPTIPYLSGVTGTWIEDSQATDPEFWAQHTCGTVRFEQGLTELLRESDRVMVEVGPGQSLSVVARRHSDRTHDQLVANSLRHRQYRQSDSAFMLTALGRLWLTGVAIDWQGFAGNERRRRVPVPTYPFERRRYWLEPDAAGDGEATARTAAESPRSDPDEWTYAAVWRQASTVSPAIDAGHEPEACWLIFGAGAVAEALAATATGAGSEPVLVTTSSTGVERLGDSRYAIRPGVQEDYATLLLELKRNHPGSTRVFHLWTLSGESGADGDAKGENPNERGWQGTEDLERQLEIGYDSLICLAQTLSESHEPVSILVATDGLARVTGDEALHSAKATLLGPVRVIPQEESGFVCRCVDVLPPASKSAAETLAQRLVSETDQTSPESRVAYRGTYRWVQEFTPVRAGDVEDSGLRQHGVYLVTGGLGGIGLALAEYLARRVAARLVLVARTPMPNRREWDDWTARHDAEDSVSRKITAIRACEAAGAEVLVVNADVANHDQMAAVLTQVRDRFGELHGVFHAAGMAGGGLIQLHTPGSSKQVLEPKVFGTKVIHDLVAGFEPDFVVLFSSILGTLGGVGQVAYCAANAFLDVFAQEASARTRWLAIDWDRWQRVGMAAEAGAADAGGIAPETGIELLERILARPASTQMVVSVKPYPDLVRRVSEAPTRAGELILGGGAGQPQLTSGDSRPDLQTPYAPPRDELEERIVNLWQQLLGITGIGIHDNFFELGGDSIRGLQLTSIARQHDIRLTVAELFEHPTIAALAALIAAGAVEEPPSESAENPPESEAHNAAFPGVSIDQEELDQLAAIYGDVDTDS